MVAGECSVGGGCLNGICFKTCDGTPDGQICYTTTGSELNRRFVECEDASVCRTCWNCATKCERRNNGGLIAGLGNTVSNVGGVVSDLGGGTNGGLLGGVGGLVSDVGGAVGNLDGALTGQNGAATSDGQQITYATDGGL